MKVCRSFVGMVNFVSIFCPELQKLLKPIYNLTRKRRQFTWGEEQQKALKKLKVDYKDLQFYIYLTEKDDFSCILTQANLLLVVHCTKFRMDSQNSLPYMGKRMPEVAKNYSIMELEMCGLAINIASFAHLLKKVDFDAIMDQLAITHIMKSKTEPTTIRIERFLELLSSYSFNLFYIKGKGNSFE